MHCSFRYVKLPFLPKPKNVAKHLGYLCKKICPQEHSKIAQSGHTAPDQYYYDTSLYTFSQLQK